MTTDHDALQTASGLCEPREEVRVSVLVNERGVVLDRRSQTGRSIKQAAIDQGVPIQLDFVLSIERGSGRTEFIGDDDEIRIHPHERFVAIPNDDNS